MLALRSVRAAAAATASAVTSADAAASSSAASSSARGKATAAAQPRALDDADEARRRPGGAPRGDQHQELLDQLQAREVRIPVPWGHIAGVWWGRTDRRPLVALHGWGDNAGSFERLAGSLRGVPVLALDLPGHGLSSATPRGLHPADRGLLLAAVRRVQRALGLTALSLVGHSLGDAVGLLYAATYPTDVDMYVSLDTLVPCPADADAVVKSSGPLVDELLEAEDALGQKAKSSSSSAASGEELLEALLASRGGSLNRHAAETLLRRGARGGALTLDPRVSRADGGVLPAPLALACARSVRCPTLAVLPQWRGPRALTADPELRHRFLADLRMASKSATAVAVAGTHHAHLNCPEVVVPALREFLLQHRTRAHDEQGVPDVGRLTA